MWRGEEKPERGVISSLHDTGELTTKKTTQIEVMNGESSMERRRTKTPQNYRETRFSSALQEKAVTDAI